MAESDAAFKAHPRFRYKQDQIDADEEKVKQSCLALDKSLNDALHEINSVKGLEKSKAAEEAIGTSPTASKEQLSRNPVEMGHLNYAF